MDYSWTIGGLISNLPETHLNKNDKITGFPGIFPIFGFLLSICPMLSPLENFYLQQEEPIRGCLIALRDLILQQDRQITAEWKYKLPFFYYQGKMLCYLWVHKKYRQPYIGLVDGNKIDHPDLLVEKRARMKILVIDPEKDLPLETITLLLNKALALH